MGSKKNQKGQKTGMVLLDVAKAYGKVWIDGLIFKLLKMEFRIALVKILHIYFKGEKYTVKIQKSK